MVLKNTNIFAKEMHYDELNAFQLTKPSKENKTVKGDVACWEIVFFLYEFKLPKRDISLLIAQEEQLHNSLSNELFWQLGYVHKINIILEATSRFESNFAPETPAGHPGSYLIRI